MILAPNWLGDAVMALPAIADVRRGAAGGDDHGRGAAVGRAAVPMVAGSRRDRARIAVPRLEHRCATARFDAALLLPNSFHAALVASRAGIPERWGYRTDWRGCC